MVRILRTQYLSSGLRILPKTWPTAARHAGVAFSIPSHPPLLPHDYGTPTEAAKLAPNRWRYALGSEFKGQFCALGQLVYYRCISDDKTAANAAAGIRRPAY